MALLRVRGSAGRPAGWAVVFGLPRREQGGVSLGGGGGRRRAAARGLPEASRWLMISAVPDGPAQGGGAEGGMSWLRGLCGVEDELLACLVDHGCVVQHVGAGDPEVLQDALDRAGHFMSRAGPDVAAWLAARGM